MAKDSDKAKEYRGLVGRQAKAQFRAKWVAQKLEAAERKMNKVQKHVITDQTDGTYLPFKKLWEAEGSDNAGFKACRN